MLAAISWKMNPMLVELLVFVTGATCEARHFALERLHVLGRGMPRQPKLGADGQRLGGGHLQGRVTSVEYIGEVSGTS
jgi:hypothetical protein